MPSFLFFCGIAGSPGRLVVTARFARLVSAAMSLSGLLGGCDARAAESVRSPAFRDGVSLHWDGVPLRSGLERLAAAHQVTVFLDRRIDPGQHVRLSVEDVPLHDLLDQIAKRSGSGVAFLGQVAYIGPKKTARMIRTVAALQQDCASKLPSREKKPWVAKTELQWPRLTSPRPWISHMCSQRGISVTGLEQIPHDLWPAGALPAMSFSDQITVLLAGFDLTLRPVSNGGRFELVSISGEERIVRRYKKPRRSHGPSLDALARRAPDAEFSVDGRTVIVRGRVEDHDLIAAAFSKSPRTSEQRPKQRAPAETKVFTLRIQNQPVGPVLRQLAKKLDLSVSLDDAAIDKAGIALEQLVSFEVEKGSVDDVLTALLTPAGLAFDRRGKEVRVFPAIAE